MTLFASKIVTDKGCIYAFEPDPETFSILEENITINNFDYVNIDNSGLGYDNKMTYIYRNLDISRGSSSIVNKGQSGGIEIRIKKLDDIIKENNIPFIKMIKIDVEGWEINVLKGAETILKSNYAPILCVEYNKTNDIDVYNYLKSINKYSFFKFKKNKFTLSKLKEIKSEEELPSEDNIFCFLPWHFDKINKRIFS